MPTVYDKKQIENKILLKNAYNTRLEFKVGSDVFLFKDRLQSFKRQFHLSLKQVFEILLSQLSIGSDIMTIVNQYDMVESGEVDLMDNYLQLFMQNPNIKRTDKLQFTFIID